MPRGLLSYIVALIIAAAAAMSASAAQAQTDVAGERLSLCIARAEPGMTAAGLLAGMARFDCTSPQTSFGPGDFWVRSGPLARTGPLRIRTMSVWQKRVTLYAHYADGVVLANTLEDHATSRHIALGAIIEQPLPARPAPLVRLLWHVEGSPNLRAIVRDPRIATPAESERFNLEMSAVYAAFAGLCIALLCYNFAVWIALRHRFQLAYCAMVTGLLLYAFSTSGALAWAWPAIANTDRIRINYLTLGLSSIAAFTFARAFFEPRVFAGVIGRIAATASGIMLSATLAYALFAQYNVHLFDTLYCWAFVGQMAVIPPILWRAWATRSNHLWLFAIAWAAPIALASLRVANAINLIGSSFWLDNSTILTMSLEALLSSIAIAYRLRLLSAERDAAREGEIAARLLADTDPLTGLLNRRAFLQQAIGRDGDQTLMIADLTSLIHGAGHKR